MPVMYHFRIDKVISAESEKSAYKQLVTDLEKHSLNDFFEFSAKEKDMDDENGKLFRFTAKVRSAGEIDENLFDAELETLVKHLSQSYGISLANVQTTEAKLKNSVIKSNKTITKETFDRLTMKVHEAINQAALSNEQKTRKMASLWADDSEYNIFKKVQALSAHNDLTEVDAQLNQEQTQLTLKLEAVKLNALALEEIQSDIATVNQSLDASNLDANAQAIVQQQRDIIIPRAENVTENPRPNHDKKTYRDFTAVEDASSMVASIETHKPAMKNGINQQHETKGRLGKVTNRKSSAEQAFDRHFFDAHIDSTIRHLSEDSLDALELQTGAINIKFEAIRALNFALKQARPNNVQADIDQATKELAKLKTALTLQEAFQLRYERPFEMTPDLNKALPEPITHNKPMFEAEKTDSEHDSEDESVSVIDLEQNESIPMLHYRLELNIDASQKEAFDDFKELINKGAKKGSLLEARVKTYTNKEGNPTIFMLRVEKKGRHTPLVFAKELANVLKKCAEHGVDIQAFEGKKGKEGTSSNKEHYVTEDGLGQLNTVLNTIKARLPSKAFDRVKAALPQNDEEENDFLKIERLAQGAELKQEQATLAAEKDYLNKVLEQVETKEKEQKTLLGKIKNTADSIQDLSALSVDEDAKQWVNTLQKEALALAAEREQLMPSQGIKHPEVTMASYPDMFSIKSYSNTLQNPEIASGVMLPGALRRVKSLKHKSGFLSSSTTMPSAIAENTINTCMHDAIEQAKNKLTAVTKAHDETLALFKEVNGDLPGATGNTSLKSTLNGKKTAIELHKENALLMKQLAKLQLAVELAEGIQLTTLSPEQQEAHRQTVREANEIQQTAPPIPTFSPEEQEDKQTISSVLNSTIDTLVTLEAKAQNRKAATETIKEMASNFAVDTIENTIAEVESKPHTNLFPPDMAEHKDNVINPEEAIDEGSHAQALPIHVAQQMAVDKADEKHFRSTLKEAIEEKEHEQALPIHVAQQMAVDKADEKRLHATVPEMGMDKKQVVPNVPPPKPNYGPNNPPPPPNGPHPNAAKNRPPQPPPPNGPHPNAVKNRPPQPPPPNGPHPNAAKNRPPQPPPPNGPHPNAVKNRPPQPPPAMSASLLASIKNGSKLKKSSNTDSPFSPESKKASSNSSTQEAGQIGLGRKVQEDPRRSLLGNIKALNRRNSSSEEIENKLKAIKDEKAAKIKAQEEAEYDSNPLTQILRRRKDIADDASSDSSSGWSSDDEDSNDDDASIASLDSLAVHEEEVVQMNEGLEREMMAAEDNNAGVTSTEALPEDYASSGRHSPTLFGNSTAQHVAKEEVEQQQNKDDGPKSPGTK